MGQTLTIRRAGSSAAHATGNDAAILDAALDLMKLLRQPTVEHSNRRIRTRTVTHPPINREISDCPLVIAVDSDRADAAVGTGRRAIGRSCSHEIHSPSSSTRSRTSGAGIARHHRQWDSALV
jgi:hypothetical protein